MTGDVVLSLMAHPDDAELLAAGTLIRLVREHGFAAEIASMTPGDCGSSELSSDEIARVRRGEAARAAALLGARYHCLEERDLRIFYEERSLAKVTRLLRPVRPRLVVTHSPDDYMLDHEMTSRIARAACFAAPVPNYEPDPALPPLEQVPHLYYADAIEGRDALGRDLSPGLYVDVSAVIDQKAAMLACHESQRAWLLRQHGIDDYLESMRRWSARRGAERGVAFAEAFRQHLGHAYPHDDLVASLLGAVSG
jgi:LmbE family N-acetylglucosaminyl deacetylase